jgi:hypothetical protein
MILIFLRKLLFFVIDGSVRSTKFRIVDFCRILARRQTSEYRTCSTVVEAGNNTRKELELETSSSIWRQHDLHRSNGDITNTN